MFSTLSVKLCENEEILDGTPKSKSVLLILLYKYGVNFTASMIIVFKLTIFNYYFVFLNREPIHLKRLIYITV